MTATESLRSSPKHLDRLNSFLTEDEVGVLFLKALTEKVFGQVPNTHDQSNHGTIFRAGRSSGAAEILSFIHNLDPAIVAEDIARQQADNKIKQPTQLPSSRIAQIMRTRPEEAPKFPLPPPPVENLSKR